MIKPQTRYIKHYSQNHLNYIYSSGRGGFCFSFVSKAKNYILYTQAENS